MAKREKAVLEQQTLEQRTPLERVIDQLDSDIVRPRQEDIDPGARCPGCRGRRLVVLEPQLDADGLPAAGSFAVCAHCWLILQIGRRFRITVWEGEALPWEVMRSRAELVRLAGRVQDQRDLQTR